MRKLTNVEMQILEELAHRKACEAANGFIDTSPNTTTPTARIILAQGAFAREMAKNIPLLLEAELRQPIVYEIEDSDNIDLEGVQKL